MAGKEFQELECYADNAKNIFTAGQLLEENLELIAHDEKVREYRNSGISYSSCKLLRAFHKFLSKTLGNDDVPTRQSVGSINQTLRMNECEILTWCFAVYLLIVEDTTFFRIIKSQIENGGKIILKFQTIQQMVIASAIFAKMVNNQEQDFYGQAKIDEDSHRLIGAYGLNDTLILKMYKQIQSTLDDPVRIQTQVSRLIQAQAFEKQHHKAIFDYNATVESLTDHDITNKINKFKFDVHGNPIELAQKKKLIVGEKKK